MVIDGDGVEDVREDIVEFMTDGSAFSVKQDSRCMSRGGGQSLDEILLL